MKLKKILDIVIFPFLILAAFYPLARLYVEASPPWGMDFYNIATYVSYLDQYFRPFPPSIWKYVWHGGMPLSSDNAWFHIYAMLPFSKIFGLVSGIRIYLALTLGLFFLAAYFFFKKLSQSGLCAALVTIALIGMSSYYVPLFKGGNTTFSASLFFLPLVLIFLKLFLENQSRNYLLVAALLTGLAFVSHIGFAPIMVFLPAALFLGMHLGQRPFREILGGGFLYSVFSLLLGASTLVPMVIYYRELPREPQILEAMPHVFSGLLVEGGVFFWISLTVGILLAFFGGWRKFVKGAIPLLATLSFPIFWFFLFFLGRNPLGEILPDRIYWLPLFLVGALIAQSWGAMRGVWQKVVLSALLLAAILSSPFISRFPFDDQAFKKERIAVENIAYPWEANKVIEGKISLKGSRILPSWLDVEDSSQRLWCLDSNLNLWWNTVSKISDIHGFFSGVRNSAANWIYLLDTAITGELAERWGSTVEEARNTAFFLIDWYGISLLEGTAPDSGWQRAYHIPLDPYLYAEDGVVELPAEQGQETSFMNPLTGPTTERLQFFEVREQFRSPLVEATNSPSLLMIGDYSGYDSLMRDLAARNINSQRLIPVYGGKSLTGVELENFSGLFIYKADKVSEAEWGRIGSFVESGGRLFVEGSEWLVGNGAYPKVLPVDSFEKGLLDFSGEWEGSIGSLKLDAGDLKDGGKMTLAPLKTSQGDSWTLFYASEGSLRSWAKPLLSAEDRVLIASGEFGQGRVAYSGLNLPYHILSFKNKDESALLEEIIFWLLEGKEGEKVVTNYSRPSPEEVVVKARGFKGVIFKDNAYPGWVASACSQGECQNLKVYSAGPDVMFVSLPERLDSEATVTFRFRNTFLAWFLYVLFLVLTIFILEKWLLKGRLFSNRLGRVLAGLKGGASSWWAKDEEV